MGGTVWGGRTVLAGLEGGALDVAVCFEGFSESEGREDREVHEGVEQHLERLIDVVELSGPQRRMRRVKYSDNKTRQQPHNTRSRGAAPFLIKLPITHQHGTTILIRDMPRSPWRLPRLCLLFKRGDAHHAWSWYMLLIGHSVPRALRLIGVALNLVSVPGQDSLSSHTACARTGE